MSVDLQDLAKDVWGATVKLLEEFEKDPSEISLTVLERVHSVVDNAAIQVSAEISKRRHPAHFADCHRCKDKGMLPRCPECHKKPEPKEKA